MKMDYKVTRIIELKMDKLHDVLLAIEQTDIPVYYDRAIDENILDSNHELVRLASNLACELLIDSNGRCNRENMEKLENLGYPVFPIEKDSFGWLIGGIGVMGGIITFA
jgi:hypothetical protein